MSVLWRPHCWYRHGCVASSNTYTANSKPLAGVDVLVSGSVAGLELRMLPSVMRRGVDCSEAVLLACIIAPSDGGGGGGGGGANAPGMNNHGVIAGQISITSGEYVLTDDNNTTHPWMQRRARLGPRAGRARAAGAVCWPLWATPAPRGST